MNKQAIFTVLLTFASVCCLSGCDINSMMSSKSSSRANSEKLLDEAREQLPLTIDAHTTLVKIEKTPSGNLDYWYIVSDEMSSQARRMGREKIRERIEKNKKKLIDSNPNAVALAEQGYIIHHIYENKYGTHLYSFTVSPEAISGEDTVGKQRSNPFAVKNVSRSGKK